MSLTLYYFLYLDVNKKSNQTPATAPKTPLSWTNCAPCACAKTNSKPILPPCKTRAVNSWSNSRGSWKCWKTISHHHAAPRIHHRAALSHHRCRPGLHRRPHHLLFSRDRGVPLRHLWGVRHPRIRWWAVRWLRDRWWRGGTWCRGFLGVGGGKRGQCIIMGGIRWWGSGVMWGMHLVGHPVLIWVSRFGLFIYLLFFIVNLHS